MKYGTFSSAREWADANFERALEWARTTRLWSNQAAGTGHPINAKRWANASDKALANAVGWASRTDGAA